MPPKKAPLQSTQKYLNILAIREGVVVLRDGGLRLILRAGSINFALKSEEEQNGLIDRYQGFLNALKFPIQILIQSRRLDLYNYLNFLKAALEKQTNDIIRMQTEDYIAYIERLITKANIMDKKFYIVIPLFPTGIQRPGLLDRLLGSAKTNDVHYTTQQFKDFHRQLTEKASVITSELASMGISAEILNTQEIVETFYGVYNPEEALNERLLQINELQVPIVRGKQEKVSPTPALETKVPASQMSPNAVNDIVPDKASPPPAANTAGPVNVGGPVDVQGQQFYATPQVIQSEQMVTPTAATPPVPTAVPSPLNGEAPAANPQAPTPPDQTQQQN